MLHVADKGFILLDITYMVDKGFILLDVTGSGQRIYLVRYCIWWTKELSCKILHMADKGFILLDITYYLVRCYMWRTKDLFC